MTSAAPDGAGEPGEPLRGRFRDFQASLDRADGGRRRRQSGRPATKGRGKGGREAGEQVNVPPVGFRSYYGRPILKAPVWKHDIPAYLFAGGLAAGTSLVAAGAQLTGRPGLRRVGRWAALGAVSASTYFLIHDLGRPERFHHMLRVVKVTSPMSVGTWILAAFGPAAGLAAVAELAPRLPRRGPLGLARRVVPPVGNTAGLVAATVAPALATYTGVLLADTAVPSWHDAYPDLPFLFAGSALAAASGVALIAAPAAETGPVRRLALAGAAVELVGGRRLERLGLTSEPYRQGRSGGLLRAGRVLLAAGVAAALLGRRSRVVSALSGAALLAASLATRFGVYEAGVASARDPKYTVVPQRERLDQNGAAARR
ncbi:NrfD/PsrC family molybdoenzyme membrane anchor subunit [Micromonospora sp. DT47]|uniref:NrfD/PsrC family molybdoenzyme membrane anchor subunit n=1 Tax=Micromonospora sp. DT47 TaxID=3393431 RepID=UPI003CF5276A